MMGLALRSRIENKLAVAWKMRLNVEQKDAENVGHDEHCGGLCHAYPNKWQKQHLIVSLIEVIYSGLIWSGWHDLGQKHITYLTR